MSVSDFFGSLGVSILLIAFALNALGRLKTNNKIYLGLNFIGAALAGWSAFLVKFYPFIVLEIFWCCVALYGVFRKSNNNVPRGKDVKNV